MVQPVQERKIRIPVAAPLAPTESGGPASHLRWFLREVPKRLPSIAVSVVGFWKVRHLPAGLRHLAYLFRLWRAARGARLLYALDPFSVGAPAAVVARLQRIPLVLRVPGDFAWEQGMLRGAVIDDVEQFACGRWRHAPLRVRLLAWVQRWVAQQATVVVVPSWFVARLVRCWGVSDARIRVVPSIPSMPHASGNKAALRAVMGIEGPLLVGVGRLVPWKRFGDAIQALRIVRRTHPPARLILVGDGPERERLAALAQLEGLKEAVQFAGALPAETTHRYLEAADVLVLPSLYEGLSHTLLEAMLLGTPVVASRCGGNPEVVEDGRSGFLVPPKNPRALAAAINRVLQLPERDRHIIANRAAQRARSLMQRAAAEGEGVIAVLKEVGGA